MPPEPATAGLAHRFVETNGARMHYVEAGSGPPVVLLHGFPQTWYEWRHQLAALAGRFRLIAPDTRGFGETDKPPGPYSRKQLAADIAGLLDALGIARAHIVGHDWGGIIAFKFACDYPRRLDRLVLIDTITTLWHPVAMNHGLWFKVKGEAERAFAEQGGEFAVRSIRGVTVNQAAFSEADLDVYRRAFAQPEAQRAAIEYYRHALPFWRVIADEAAPHGERYERLSLREITAWQREGVETRPYARDYLDFAPSDRLRVIARPTLWIHGMWRGRAPDPRMVAHMRRHFPDLRIAAQADCGHFVPEEKPEEVSRLLQDFLGDGA